MFASLSQFLHTIGYIMIGMVNHQILQMPKILQVLFHIHSLHHRMGNKFNNMQFKLFLGYLFLHKRRCQFVFVPQSQSQTSATPLIISQYVVVPLTIQSRSGNLPAARAPTLPAATAATTAFSSFHHKQSEPLID